jgi:hypothetical protein
MQKMLVFSPGIPFLKIWLLIIEGFSETTLKHTPQKNKGYFCACSPSHSSISRS